MSNKFPLENSYSKDREKIIEQLREALCSGKPNLAVCNRLLAQWKDYSHPFVGLLYYKRWGGQATSKGVTPGHTLGLLLGLTGSGIRSIFNEYADGTLAENTVKRMELLGCKSNCREWISWLLEYGNFTLIGRIGQFAIAYVVVFALVVALTFLLGYIAGRFTYGYANVGLSLNGLYHIYPGGRRYSPWSQFCAVRWWGESSREHIKMIKWLAKSFPIRLLLSDGSSIRIWCPRKDREWLTEVMELLIAHHHADLKGKLLSCCQKAKTQ